jgi:hypothetical protein
MEIQPQRIAAWSRDQPYLIVPLAARLDETTVSTGGDAGGEGGANSDAEIRHTFPNR